MKNPFRSLRKFLIIIFGIVGFGVLGFMLIEDYSFRDAIYMTVQVVSTVGFNEVQQFHQMLVKQMKINKRLFFIEFNIKQSLFFILNSI